MDLTAGVIAGAGLSSGLGFWSGRRVRYGVAGSPCLSSARGCSARSTGAGLKVGLLPGMGSESLVVRVVPRLTVARTGAVCSSPCLLEGAVSSSPRVGGVTISAAESGRLGGVRCRVTSVGAVTSTSVCSAVLNGVVVWEGEYVSAGRVGPGLLAGLSSRRRLTVTRLAAEGSGLRADCPRGRGVGPAPALDGGGRALGPPPGLGLGLGLGRGLDPGRGSGLGRTAGLAALVGFPAGRVTRVGFNKGRRAGVRFGTGRASD